MLYGPDPYDSHTRAVDALGIDPPPLWSELRTRFDSFVANPPDPLALLSTAVLGGDDDAVRTLYPLALASTAASPAHHVEVTQAVRTTVLSELRGIYAPVARANYQTVAARFNDIATHFRTAANTTDPEATGDALVSAPEKQRRAWSDAERHRHQLDSALPALQAAASLLGVPTPTTAHLIELTCDHNNVHRRRLWEAFTDHTGRTGRWGRITALGAVIRAHRIDAGFTPYREPAPMQIKQVRVGLGVRQVEVDPEDELVTAAAP